MRSRVRGSRASAAGLGAALLMATLVMAAGASWAQEGREARRGDRPQQSGERVQSGESARGEARVQRRDAGQQRGSGDAARVEQDRRGDRPQRGGGEHMRRGGGGDRDRGYGGGQRGDNGGGRHYGGGGYYGAPRHYYDGGYRAPYRYRYARPHRAFRVRIGFGLPYYCPPSYRSYAVRRPFVRDYVPSIDVENDPPAGCYYYDPSCEREFATLDDYTEHLDSADHTSIVEIVDESTGERVRVLEFVDGYWSVQR